MLTRFVRAQGKWAERRAGLDKDKSISQGEGEVGRGSRMKRTKKNQEPKPWMRVNMTSPYKNTYFLPRCIMHIRLPFHCMPPPGIITSISSFKLNSTWAAKWGISTRVEYMQKF